MSALSDECRKWQQLSQEAMDDAREWKRQAREAQTDFRTVDAAGKRASEERDALLAALRELVADIDARAYRLDRSTLTVMERASAAIAKAEGAK